MGFEPGGSDQRLLHETYILIILKIVKPHIEVVILLVNIMLTSYNANQKLNDYISIGN